MFFKLLDNLFNRRAKKLFLMNVTYKGSNETLEILRYAHARPFRGSSPRDIIIGDGFRLFGGAIVSQNGGKIVIGENVQFGFNTLVGAANSVTIGDYAIFADNVTIMDNNNHPVNPLDRAIIYRRTDRNSEYRGWKYSISLPIVIGNNVWCGSNVRINKGVTIGDGAVIAANTVVVKDVPANSICAGNPGKIVKINIDKIHRLIPDDAI